MRDKSVFRFKQFNIRHSHATMKVGTDGVLLGAWAGIENTKRILDVGTGTGVIALMLAQRTSPDAHIDAIDISAEDCEVAQQNVAQSPWPEKIKVHHAALQEYFSEPYDLIVSNPPYFINSYKPPTEKRIQARHTEQLSFADLLTAAGRLLTPSGSLQVVLPCTEGLQLIMLAERHALYCARKWSFRTRANKPIERLLLEFSRQKRTVNEGEILLYDTADEWSDQYRLLTRDFYLKL
ncbi:MAG: methyltransferase [Cyclobacteriaceae bacterium]|nr:methyltransferase [Cyclobacteriaceae bacterium]